jgi:FkbM family methyltransferase
LKRNTKSYSNVYLSNKLLGEKNILIKGKIVSSGGTANIEKTSEEIAETTTLDILIHDEFKDFLNSDIIKIDTDGYDYKIIRGAYNILKHKSPILFFELAPEELINNGIENPLEIFPIFNELNYHYFI